MKHFKSTLYALLPLLLIGIFFGQIAPARAYTGDGPYAYIKTLNFSPATPEDTQVTVALDWNTNWVPSSVWIYYTVDAPLSWSKFVPTPGLLPVTIDLGQLSAGTHNISFGLFGSNVIFSTTIWTVTYNPISFSVTAPPPPPPPPGSSFSGTISFTANPTAVAYGGSTTLFWFAPLAYSCTASGSWSGTKSFFGFETRSGLTSDQTYILNCGSASASRTVTVAMPACPLPWGSTISDGQSVTAYSQPYVTTPAVCTDASVMETRTCNMGTLSGSYTNQFCTERAPEPTVSLTSSPSVVDAGQTVLLSWDSEFTTSCVADAGFSTGGATSGSARTDALTEDTTFRITCTDGTTSVAALRNVNVRNPQATISASPSRVAVGGSSTISWQATDVTSSACTVSGPGLSQSRTRSGSRAVTISAQSEYVISCRTRAGTTISSSVIVNVAPTYEEF